MPYIPGSPIQAYCAQCRNDTNHVVLEASGTQIRSVRCEKCGHEGSFRSPRARTKAALIEIAERKKRTSIAPRQGARHRKSTERSPEVIFAQLVADRDLTATTPYDIASPLTTGTLIEHPTFGIGLVTEMLTDQKAKVVFRSGERILICNRRG